MKFPVPFALDAWTAFALYGSAHTSALGAPSATVSNGTYTGVSVPSFKQEHFLGMPYAQPPLPPALRMRAPQPLNTSWTGTRAATAYSPFCIGYPAGDADDDAGYELSEDCLTVNVVRPLGVKEGSDVPVVVWI
jgi:acetylcholinesterase